LVAHFDKVFGRQRGTLASIAIQDDRSGKVRDHFGDLLFQSAPTQVFCSRDVAISVFLGFPRVDNHRQWFGPGEFMRANFLDPKASLIGQPGKCRTALVHVAGLIFSFLSSVSGKNYRPNYATNIVVFGSRQGNRRAVGHFVDGPRKGGNEVVVSLASSFAKPLGKFQDPSQSKQAMAKDPVENGKFSRGGGRLEREEKNRRIQASSSTFVCREAQRRK
jgi:hypothetical protein